MISPVTGETTFHDLRILPQSSLPTTVAIRTRRLPLTGWSGHFLGSHQSDRGLFDVEAVTDPQHRVQILLLACSHPFFKPNTPDDAERRAFHEGLINSELGGRREFSWGEVLCRFDAFANKDWLVLAFAPGPPIPDTGPRDPLHLHAYAADSGNK